MKPIRIVITGGPCGGKTSALPYLKQRLTEIGYNVVTSPESATLLHGFGFNLTPTTCREINVERQVALMKTQMALEDSMAVMHLMSSKPTIVLSDRGAMDSKSYTPEGLWGSVLHRGGWDDSKLREGRYNAVFHLVSAAIGTDLYTKTNNLARFETAEQAVAADTRTQQAWVGHPHLRIIDNSTDFEGKLERLFDAVKCYLDHKEVERRYLVKSEAFNLEMMHRSVNAFISQTYLTSTPTEIRRLRRRHNHGQSPVYYLTIKSRTPGVVRDEFEEIISSEQYNILFAEFDPSRERIDKTRWFFLWKNRQFELDVFEWYGQSGKPAMILEVEMDHPDEKIDLPPFISIEKEVTDDPSYSNWALAARV